MNQMTRRQAIDFLASEVTLSLNYTSDSTEDYDAGLNDMYRAFAALGIDRKEVDGE